MIDNNDDTKSILWGPRNKKALKKLYPELDNEIRFKGVENADLLFAWYLGIPNSPIDNNLDDRFRWRSAAKHCFPDGDKKMAYANGDFPEEVKVAIERFRNYAPEARSTSKNIVQKIFHNFEKMVDVDMDTDFLIIRTIGKGEDREEIKEIDWTAKKQYVDSATKIAESLPVLLKQIEEGFGIIDKKTDENTGAKSIDKYHQNNKSKSS